MLVTDPHIGALPTNGLLHLGPRAIMLPKKDPVTTKLLIAQAPSTYNMMILCTRVAIKKGAKMRVPLIFLFFDP